MNRPAARPELHVVDGSSAQAGTPSQRPERALVARARAGDPRAWERLYTSQYRDVLRFVSYATGDVTVAEDITQETFAQAVAGLAKFDERATFSTWIRAIAMNLVRKQWRKGERRSRAYARLKSVPPTAPGPQPDDELVRERRADALDAVLTTLPESLREAFVLTDVHGMAAAEAAAIVGTTAGNIRVRATRARARLQEALVAAGFLDAEGKAL